MTGTHAARALPTEPVVRVDPVACDGIGVCGHLAPAVISVDVWGYPIIASEPLDRRRLRAAEAAITACPRRALFITQR